ncbi:MAG TPA: beta-ketoacyl synthase N-terminal-like domain-containing protein, partial [Solirubrobacteraceae bacterium]|nr:beta-ketoacyl synthase N-terminal-like domain-containing protein [Solirubrobacteraceae bacterium]
MTPLGVGARTLHERWSAGASGLEDGEGACTEFDPTTVMTSKEARRSDRFSQLAVAACAEALEEAGWNDDGPYPSQRIGCVLGTGIGGIGTLEANHAKLLEGGPASVSPLAVPLMMGNAGAASLSMRHGLRGVSYGIVSACAAGAHAIGASARAIQAGDTDAMVTG